MLFSFHNQQKNLSELKESSCPSFKGLIDLGQTHPR